MDASANALSLPPFPPLTWDEFRWTGTLILPAWAGFQSRLGPYGSASTAEPSDGTALLDVSVGEASSKWSAPPSPAQAAAMEFLLDNQDAIRDTILDAAFALYHEHREEFGPREGEDDSWMPPISEPNDLKALMGLNWVHVLQEEHAGAAYVGFEFGCEWEIEHGVGVMMHRDRVVEVGGADSSFLCWIAAQDAEAQG